MGAHCVPHCVRVSSLDLHGYRGMITIAERPKELQRARI